VNGPDLATSLRTDGGSERIAAGPPLDMPHGRNRDGASPVDSRELKL
jgi:hypothetical protein